MTNEQQRAELARLQQRQEGLRRQLEQLDADLQRIGEACAHAAKEIQPMEISPLEISALNEVEKTLPNPAKSPPLPVGLPPIISEVRAQTAGPPPLPPVLPPPSPALVGPTPLFENKKSSVAQAASAPVPPLMGAASEKARASAPEKNSLEMRLGAYWLVRIGIFVCLTGLVFAGNYAYQNWLGNLGAGGKLSLLYLASGLLVGSGAWLQRPGQKESLKNYAQVLFAGGLAAIYFTTYAAHHLEPVRVIENPRLGGALLLAWAGCMIWLADRKKSEVLAVFALGLAYYSSSITRIGVFTLCSNLVLTIASVFLLLRHRWITLSFGSLVATYASFAFWRFFHHGWLGDGGRVELWQGNWFLGGYWMVFTAAVLLSRNEKLTGGARALFASGNNGAFFGLVVLSMLRLNEGGFWKFSFGFGVVLLGLTLVARRHLSHETALQNSYLTQGLLFVTLGFITYFSGLQLALMLAAESVVLWTLGLRQKNPTLQVGAYLTAFFATIGGWGALDATSAASLGAGVGAFLVFNAFWAVRQNGENEKSLFRPAVTYFATLGLSLWLATTWKLAPTDWVAPLLAMEAVGLTASFYLWRVREIVLLGQGFLGMAQLRWLFHALEKAPPGPWQHPMIVISVTLGLSFWWQRQKSWEVSAALRNFLQGVYALAVIGVIFHWLNPHFHPASWLAVTSLLALGITAGGIATRAWMLAGGGQIFLFVSVGEFVRQVSGTHPAWFFALTPIGTLLVLALGGAVWIGKSLQSSGDAVATIREPLLYASRIYRSVAVGMTWWWISEYLPGREQFWVLSVLGAGLFVIGLRGRNQEAVCYSGVFFLAGFLHFFWLPPRSRAGIYWMHLPALLVWPALQQWVKWKGLDVSWLPKIHFAMIVPASLGLWLYVSRWVISVWQGHFFLTASWAVLALVVFGMGLVRRERIYRWLGLIILGSALGRVFLSDIWKLETGYRILSFMALGLVLLAVGFFYNKYQEKIKEWI